MKHRENRSIGEVIAFKIVVNDYVGGLELP